MPLTRTGWDLDRVSEPKMNIELCIQPAEPAVGDVFSCSCEQFTMSPGPGAAWGPPDKVSCLE